jgi:RNA polymerase sigma factor (sigma-70 family)
MTGSHETSEELTQEVFVRVLKGLDQYSERGQERAWLFQIARNLRCDHTRQQHRRLPSTPFEDVELIEPQRQELRLRLTHALTTLSDDEREAFVLVEICGFSYEEISLICETTPASIRSRIYRARIALRRMLEPPTSRERSLVRGTHV